MRNERRDPKVFSSELFVSAVITTLFARSCKSHNSPPIFSQVCLETALGIDCTGINYSHVHVFLHPNTNVFSLKYVLFTVFWRFLEDIAVLIGSLACTGI